MIYSIQAYRGFAALLVVAYHANSIGGKYFEQTSVSNFFSFGHSGVPFFFVLSGFIIYHIHHADIGIPVRAKRYLEKRILRIYPIYWIITLSIIPVYLLVPSFGSQYHRELAPLIKSLLLIPQSHSPHLSVAWTLCHEMFFYLLFAVLIYKKVLGKILLFTWMLLTASAFFSTNIAGATLTFPSTFFFSTYNLLFGFGLFAGWLNKIRWPTYRSFGLTCFLLGNILFLAIGCVENYWTGTNDRLILLFGLAAFMLVLSAGDERVERLFKNNSILQLLGNASYSIYLTHYVTVSVLGKMIASVALLSSLPSTINWALLIAVATAVGVLLYTYVEKPIISWARRRADASKQPAVTC